MGEQTILQPGEPSGYSPLSAYRLGIEADPTRTHRVRLVGGAVAFAFVAYLLAWHSVHVRHTGGVVAIGFGRLANLVEQWGWQRAWVISTLEYVHYGLMFTVCASVVWFGQTKRELKLPGEELIFHRRQSRWIASNAAAAGIIAFIVAGVAIDRGWDFVAGIIEIFGVSLLGGALWQALVPEARLSVSVFLCPNMGWGNRIIISGGFLRSASRLTIIKDCLISASARDFGGLEMLGGARGLELKFKDDGDCEQRLRIPAISSDPEIGILASTLNTKFKRAMTMHILTESTRLGRRFPIFDS
jgi:hypothetical protein